MTIYDRIKSRREELGMSQQDLADKLGYKSRSAINKIESGLRDINQSKISDFADALETTPAYLMGWEDEPRKSFLDKYPEPRITEDVVTFPVIGEVAAGFEHIALEDWGGDTVDVPVKYLHGRPKSDYIVLTVKGDSMYPLYLDGDKVLVLKQSTLNRSGEIGLIRYGGENATLKKVEYVMGEDWMKLIPLNPQYPPKMIEGADLEQCEVIGIPRLLVREIEQ